MHIPYSYGLDLMSGKICAVWSLPIPTEKNCCGSQNKPQFVQATQKMSSLCGNRRKLILIPLIESVCFFLEKLLLMKTRKTQLLNNISCNCVKLTLLFLNGDNYKTCSSMSISSSEKVPTLAFSIRRSDPLTVRL